MPKRSKGLGIYIAILVVLSLVAVMLISFQTEPQSYKYTEIVSYFQQNKVKEFTLDMGTGELVISKMDGLNSGERVTYRVPHVGLFLQEVEKYVYSYNRLNPDSMIVGDIKRAQEMPWWVTFLPTLLLIGLMVVFWVIMMRQSRGGGGNVAGFGKAKARTGTEGRKVTFVDVAGADEEKQELVEIVEFLKAPGKFNALGARIPKGVLLVGPPGTGKTLLARAVAGEAEVEFFSISGSDFVEMFVGVGASRVRDLFEQAKKHAPSVIFIDEIDAVGRQRGAGLGGGHDEREQTLNQLLVEMDGFSANTGVIIIAATNRRDILDPALLRPGRFDRQVIVGYPDVKGREEILKVHSKNKPLGPDVELKTIAKGTVGFTGADLENLMNESALLAARRNLKAITMPEVQESMIKVLMGPEKRSMVVTDHDKRITAYHEAGHAIARFYSPDMDPVHQVSIIPRGMAGGYTMFLPKTDNNHVSKTRMYQNIVSMMGGRVAEEVALEDIHTGASQDLEQATKVARQMVTRYGFSEEIGPVVYGQDQGEVFLGRDYSSSKTMSEKVAAEIDKAIKDLLERAYGDCKKILLDHMDQLHIVSEYLLEYETIEGEDFDKLMKGELEPPADEPRSGFWDKFGPSPEIQPQA